MDKEYIEKQALIEAFEPERSVDWYTPWIVDKINEQPTADVVEVVRCLECVHCDPENRHCDHPMGTTLPIGRKETDFCSYGKKVE